MVTITGTDSQYAVHKMMTLSEKVRPCDPRKRGVLVPTQTAAGGLNAKRLGARKARSSASSASPRQLRHRVVTPAIELSSESSSVASVGLSSRLKPTSVKTGITYLLMLGLHHHHHHFIRSVAVSNSCLLYTSPSPRDGLLSRMPSSA